MFQKTTDTVEGFSRVDHPNIRTPYWRSAAETFRRSHRTRACVGGCFVRDRDAWPDRRRVKRSSDPAEARAPLCGGWTEKKLVTIKTNLL